MINKIILLGRIANDLNIKMTQNEKQVCDFVLAVDRNYGEKTDFVNIQCWNKQAENLYKYQKKGNLIEIIGELRVDKYQNKDGENRYFTYVLAEKVVFLESKKDKTEAAIEAATEEKQETFNVAEDEDLPF